MLLGDREQVSKVTVKDSPTKTGVFDSPEKASDNIDPELDDDMEPSPDKQLHDEQDIVDEGDQDDAPSEASSPVHNMGRKSSLNFASLPAREPLTAGKTLGGRTSRISYAKPPPQYPRLGSDRVPGSSERLENSESLKPAESNVGRAVVDSTVPDTTKSYTERLQDQIKQMKRPGQADNSPISSPQRPKSNAFTSPNRKESIQIAMQTTPGAFPPDDDEEDDWIEPPTTARPELPKSYSADVMEGIRDKATIGQPDFSKDQDQRLGDTQRLFDKPDAKSSSPVANRIPSVYSDTALTQIVSNEGYLPQTQRVGKTAPPSPTRSFRESPLKQMKSKLSSILKSSKSLLASSAAISAEGKSSILTPSVARYGLHNLAGSNESLQTLQKANSYASNTLGQFVPTSPTQTRSAAPVPERSTAAQAAAAEQMAKLEHAREQEREKARVFSKEQERIAAMENQIATKKQVERKPLPIKEMQKTTRSSPRKVGGKEDETIDRDIAMHDVPPPSASKTPSAAAHALRNREIKRPLKPTREPPVKAKLVPTVIRVNTGSQHSQSQYRPSSRQSTGQPESATVPAPQSQLAPKTSKQTLQPKPSTQSLRSLSAAKKKEQEEREAQRKREAKAEADRKKLAAQEEQKRQDQRRAELERQKLKEREQADEKKNAARQAAIEKAKQTRAPPPAVRSQPNGPPDFSLSQQKQMLSSAQKPEAPGARPPSRLAQASGSVVGGSKAAQKRPMNAEQAKDPKRRRTSETFDNEASSSQHMKGPPVRPSPGFKKDIASKSLFQSGYSNAPASVTKDIFRASVVSHQGIQKGGHPLDMAKISKGGIPFAPNDNVPASAFKTPARPGQPFAAKSIAKPVSRPSPQFQNGESIDLPEIFTDDEDEDEDPGMQVAPWADSPALKQALVYQETLDPSQIFGAPGPLVMEEVFSKNKERWGKFRARTSSANWSGLDRLTEDDVRKDMAAREKLRREGGWSYEMSRDML